MTLGVILSWISLGLTLALGILLLFSRRHSNLRLVQLYAFGFVGLSLSYKFLFSNNILFYQILAIGQAVLFALAYWEIAKKQEGKSFQLILLAAGAVVLLPLFQVTYIQIGILSFLIVDVAIALTLPFVIRTGNPFLLVWGTISAYAVALDVLELIVSSEHQVYIMMSSLDLWAPILANAGLIGVVLWEPVSSWAVRKIKELPSFSAPKLSLASGRESDNFSSEVFSPTVVEFPKSAILPISRPEPEQIQDDFQLEPILESAARMLTISNKPYLTPDEAVFYLGFDDEDELEEFISRFNIQKLHIRSKQSSWVVRRESLENID